MKKLFSALFLALLLPALALGEALPPVDLSGPVQHDVTRLGGSMAYAQVYDMLMSPESYVGHTVRLRGRYFEVKPKGADAPYRLILIRDEAACCELAMEFALTGDTGGLAFPAQDAPIELTGMMSMLEEGGISYPLLFVNGITEIESR